MMEFLLYELARERRADLMRESEYDLLIRQANEEIRARRDVQAAFVVFVHRVRTLFGRAAGDARTAHAPQ